ncbi:MAG TPA: hypothetical protein EYP56_00305 [Planctomycetaceae bacterium]|nr:hypothetical protein [Planctomycetaceae bacterium]
MSFQIDGGTGAMNPTERLARLLGGESEQEGKGLRSEFGLGSAARYSTNQVLFAPLHYESGYSYPLIVWLHGPGWNDEQQLLRVMPVISVRNYVGAAVRGFPVEGERGDGLRYDWPQTPGHIQEAGRRVFKVIEAASEKYNIAPDRVFIAGFDSGGTMAFRMAVDHPWRFAGVISLCGAFPRSYMPLRQLTAIRRLPALLAVGRDAERYTPAQACDDLRLFHTAGISVALRQYPCGHELAPQMLRDMDRWIIEQITGQNGSMAETDSSWPCSSE